MNKTPSFALLLLALAACAPSPPEEASSAARNPHLPTQAQIDRLVAEGPEQALQQLRPADYWLHYALMRATGVEEALGGEAQAVGALKALAEQYERQARGAQADLPRMVPAAFTGEGMTSGFLGLGLGGFAGLLTGGLVSSMVSEMSDAQLAEAVKSGFGRTENEHGSVELQIGEDGSLSQVFEFNGEIDDGLTGKVKLKTRMDACPDASGKVKVESDIDSSVRVSGKAGTGGYVRSHFVYERWLDDDANLIDGADGSSSNMRIDMGGFENYESQHVRLTAGWARGGRETFENRGESGYSIFRMDEVERTQKLVLGAQLIQTLMAEVMLRGMKRAPWESGRCVRLEPRTSPARRKGARPSTEFQIVAEPRAAADGAPTGGTVKATLSGGSRLAREGVKVPADARYAYTAPDRKDESASIAFEARSKRGVGKATLAFDTKRRQGYHFSCGGHDPIEQDVCGIDRPFVLDGKLFGHELSGGLSGTTKMVRHPQLPGVKWNGSGSYVMSFPDGEDRPGTMTVHAGGTTATVKASAHTTGTEQCVLTPLADCE